MPGNPVIPTKKDFHLAVLTVQAIDVRKCYLAAYFSTIRETLSCLFIKRSSLTALNHTWLQAVQPKVAKAKPEKQEPEEKEPKMEAKPEPELHQASRKGDADLVTKLLHNGHDPTVSVGAQNI